MSLHINRFIDRLKTAEGRRDRELVLTLPEARDLHSDITKLLLVVQELREKHMDNDREQPIQVELSGGSF